MSTITLRGTMLCHGLVSEEVYRIFLINHNHKLNF